MSSSVLLLAGVAAVTVAAVLLRATARLRREIEATRRLQGRVDVAIDEVERVDSARRQLDGLSLARESATGAGRVVRRSGLAIAGIPYAILIGIGRRRRGQRPDAPLQ